MTDDSFNLSRFIQAQEKAFQAALRELRSGVKKTHWMWYVFPQFEGLGFSSNSKLYAIRSLEEARRYLRHPVLGYRLRQSTEALMGIENSSASEIFGYPDDLKFHSSMTLFASVTEKGSLFDQALSKYFRGERDGRTLELIAARERKSSS